MFHRSFYTVLCAVLFVSVAHVQAQTIWAWGCNDTGQAGGNDSPVLTPHPVAKRSTRALSCGYWHSLWVTTGFGLYAWGGNGLGQLGLGDLVSQPTPTRVSGLGDLYSVHAPSAGVGHSIASNANSAKLWAWGHNGNGQLGQGDLAPRYYPTEVPDMDVGAAGYFHTLARGLDGRLYAFGANGYGQLGVGDTIDRTSPTLVSGPITGVKAIAGGYGHSMVLLNDGRLFAWGWNGYGQLGLGDKRDRLAPVEVTELLGRRVAAVSAGFAHTLAITEDGALWAWGLNSDGQLGLGDVSPRLAPVRVAGLAHASVEAVSAGGHHSLALTADGLAWGWGYNADGQLGTGDTQSRARPTEIVALRGVRPSMIAAGGFHSMALGSDGIPSADGQTVTTEAGAPRAIKLEASDPEGDPLTYVILSNPEHGSLTGTPPNVVYVSDADYVGPDVFTFVVSDGYFTSAPATVSIQVDKVKTTLYVPDRFGTIGETVILRGYLRIDRDSSPAANRPVSFTVDGSDIGSALTGATGRADVEWVLPPGPAFRILRAEFAGDALLRSSTASGVITAWTWITKIIPFDRTARIATTTELKCRLVRADNHPLYAKIVSFSVDGTFVIDRPTDVQGYATNPYYIVPDGQGSGIRTISADWPGDSGHLASSGTAHLSVLKATPYIWVMPRSVPRGGIARLSAYFRRLADYQKQEGKTVTFRVDGTWIADVVTLSGSEAGIARHSYPTVEPPGVHVIRCEFAGDAWVDSGYGEANLTIY
ncbi:MAG: hypothetical protein GX446_03690 [Chthonomonadales bacterium]|nr:hypothetical protein [Chthonomonadales bacterium]